MLVINVITIAAMRHESGRAKTGHGNPSTGFGPGGGLAPLGFGWPSGPRRAALHGGL